MRALFNKPPQVTEPLPPQDDEIAVLRTVMAALETSHGYEEAACAAINAACCALGWDLCSVWRVNHDTNKLIMDASSHRDPSLEPAPGEKLTLAKGEGVLGRAWERHEIIIEENEATILRHFFGPSAPIGATHIGLPISHQGRIYGVLSFFAYTPWIITERRIELLKCIGDLLSTALERIRYSAISQEQAQSANAVNSVLREVTQTTEESTAIQTALDTIRHEFNWEYGSFWGLDEKENVLRFVIESGDAGEEFRQVTHNSTFAKGVGVAGRTWASNNLVYEPDLGQVTDCVRAPAAQRAGVRSGVCLPIVVDNKVVGTMDFFATRTIDLNDTRREALRNTAFLVSHAIERIRGTQRISEAATHLLDSIAEVEKEVHSARTIADEAARITTDAGRIIKELDTSSTEIGAVVKTITAIAEQTNLLALNATIEAARAGEAGKGFAVVANEVKELAHETSGATDEVNLKVGRIQSDATNVSSTLDEVSAAVERINTAQQAIAALLHNQTDVTRAVLGG
ncbi:GAF domain-containing protein [Dermatophilus congolensis]|uniref:GAF domain-containing protein n=1 Tax=Dermatophilus congolensis TaxID=1863 RepID=UPI001AAE20EB|nr:methyl-accepting chemotaxis protein [Dermatophilus congolensis]MBO3143460.1 GAF domain-containing protein [Dermatophilus congolensis]MBO3152450.1 GAF domain-containing protein [Dermatophilus congolensis]MBO3160538.1 GAF domain-containing protein [Dermatophilus congolensis]MBO3163737.1 GAF domain-containing protein [Dermatophilus congolensis]MBO3177283.1 GAF domain-containing protein [Dermatophilus congolensis]